MASKPPTVAVWSSAVDRGLASGSPAGLPVPDTLANTVSQLQHLFIDNGVRSFCFVGDEWPGHSLFTGNVAAALALSGQRTILIDTNFKTPKLAKLFGLDLERPGLSEWVSEADISASWPTYMQPAQNNLVLVPAGKILRTAIPQLSLVLPRIIHELSRIFDIIVCDAPPVSDVAGSLAVVNAVERAIIVVRANQTRLDTLTDFQSRIEQHRGVIGGCVYLDV